MGPGSCRRRLWDLAVLSVFGEKSSGEPSYIVGAAGCDGGKGMDEGCRGGISCGEEFLALPGAGACTGTSGAELGGSVSVGARERGRGISWGLTKDAVTEAWTGGAGESKYSVIIVVCLFVGC